MTSQKLKSHTKASSVTISSSFLFRSRKFHVGIAGLSSLSPAVPRSIYLFIYVIPSIVDNKTVHALKSNNRTRTRVSQKNEKKIGWLAKTMRGFTLFPSLDLSLFLPLSPRLVLFIFIIPWAQHRSNDRRKRIAKGKEGRVPRGG